MSRRTGLNFLNGGSSKLQRFAWRSCALALAVATGCTEFKPESDIEDTNTGALLGNGTPPNGVQNDETAWGCLRSGPPAVTNRQTVSYTVTIVDSVTNEPPPGLVVQACDDVDIMCARPVSPRTGVSADGRVRLSLSPGFDGYFQVTSDTNLPTLLYPDGILRDDQDGILLELVDEMTAVLLARGAGVELDADSGLVLARAFNCQGQLSSGVMLQNDTGGSAFAFIDGLPIEGPVTGGEGLVVFTNVPAGYTVIEGTIADSNTPMGTTTVESRPGWLIYADVRPPP
jgi:hypothetical protein